MTLEISHVSLYSLGICSSSAKASGDHLPRHLSRKGLHVNIRSQEGLIRPHCFQALQAFPHYGPP